MFFPPFRFGSPHLSSALKPIHSHPYNPQKSITYPFSGAPSGQVTLTRSTVLSLAGWSNTQFAYWARRAEAVSVLAPYDPQLRAVARALEKRLGIQKCVSVVIAGQQQQQGAATATTTTGASASSTTGGQGTATGNEESETASSSEVTEKVTGKGLDAIIEAVKRRTGASQFLRGKHSSLDAFGSSANGANGVNGPGGGGSGVGTGIGGVAGSPTSGGSMSGSLSPTVAPSFSMSCLELSPPAPVPPESATFYLDGAMGRHGLGLGLGLGLAGTTTTSVSSSSTRGRSNSMPVPVTSWIERKPDITGDLLRDNQNAPSSSSSSSSTSSSSSLIQTQTHVVTYSAKNPTFQAEKYRHSPPLASRRQHTAGHQPRGTPGLTISTAGLRGHGVVGRARRGTTAGNVNATGTGEELEDIPEKVAVPAERETLSRSDRQSTEDNLNLNNNSSSSNSSSQTPAPTPLTVTSPMSYICETPLTSPISSISTTTLATEVPLRRNDIMFNAHVRPGMAGGNGGGDGLQSPISVLFSPTSGSGGGVEDVGDSMGGGVGIGGLYARQLGKRKSQQQHDEWFPTMKSEEEERVGLILKRSRM